VPALTFFEARLFYPAVSIDVSADLDPDPQLFGTSATVIVTPFVHHPLPPDADDVTAANIQAQTLTPDPAMLILATIKARLDNGRLMIRADPDRVVHTFANLAAFPTPGDSTKLYRAADTQLVYAWNGTTYVQVDDFAPLRLVAQTDVLGLPPDATLCYQFAFSNITYPAATTAEQHLPTFAVAAATSDTVLDLATAPRVALNPR
jgi:hypothetical protein